MRVELGLLLSATALAVAACDSGGVSTAEMQTAAVERARQQLSLPSDTPLETQVWAGQEYRGDLVYCGTVSGQGQGLQITPQRFAATTEPLRWLVFEDSHNPLRSTGGDQVPDWVNLCGTGAAG
jgi:hypothetical protein